MKIKAIKDKTLDSIWERNFEKTLIQLKLSYEKHKIIGPYLIDYFIKPNICINIDGPSHFIGDSKLYKSKSIFRDKILGLMKFNAISIPYFKCKRGNENEEDNKNFIKSLIKI